MPEHNEVMISGRGASAKKAIRGGSSFRSGFLKGAGVITVVRRLQLEFCCGPFHSGQIGMECMVRG